MVGCIEFCVCINRTVKRKTIERLNKNRENAYLVPEVLKNTKQVHFSAVPCTKDRVKI